MERLYGMKILRSTSRYKKKNKKLSWCWQTRATWYSGIWNHFSFSFYKVWSQSFQFQFSVDRSVFFLPARRSRPKRSMCYGNVAGWMSLAGIVSKRLNLVS